MHPITDDETIRIVWGEMERLQQEGMVKSLGITNCTVALYMNMIKFVRVKPSVN